MIAIVAKVGILLTYIPSSVWVDRPNMLKHPGLTDASVLPYFFAIDKSLIYVVAEDVGGPRKEWLQNYLKAANSKLVEDRVVLEKQASLESKEYYCLGVMMGEYVT
mgnify:CR=1 FL=1